MTFASDSSRVPAGVSTGLRPTRLNSVTPRSVSRLEISVLTADCALRNARPAAEKEPCSAAATKASNWSIEIVIYLIFRYYLTLYYKKIR